MEENENSDMITNPRTGKKWPRILVEWSDGNHPYFPDDSSAGEKQRDWDMGFYPQADPERRT
jgi:hypothetical protein